LERGGGGGGPPSSGASTPRQQVGTPRTRTFTKKSAASLGMVGGRGSASAASSPLLSMIPMAAVYIGNDVPFPSNLLSSYCAATRHSAAYCFETPQDRFHTHQDGPGVNGDHHGGPFEGEEDEEADHHDDDYRLSTVGVSGGMASPNPRRQSGSQAGGALTLPTRANHVHQVPLNCAGVCWTLSSAVDSDPNSHYEPTFLPMTAGGAGDNRKRMVTGRKTATTTTTATTTASTSRSAGGVNGAKGTPRGNISPRGRRTVSPSRATPRQAEEKQLSGEHDHSSSSRKPPARQRFGGLDAFQDVRKVQEKKRQEQEAAAVAPTANSTNGSGGGGGGGILKKRKQEETDGGVMAMEQETSSPRRASPLRNPTRFQDPSTAGVAVSGLSSRSGSGVAVPSSNDSGSARASPVPRVAGLGAGRFGEPLHARGGSYTRTPISDVSSH
jgi:hypothetical protein